jgi:hypothetical protein
MAASYKLLRDWIVHGLGPIARMLSEKEIQVSLAEITREIQAELVLRECTKTGDVTYYLSTQLATLPTDLLKLERLSIEEEDGTTWIDLLDWRNIGERLRYSEIRKGYAYVIARTLKFSWQVSSDTTVTLYYVPMHESAEMPVSEDRELGEVETDLPGTLQRALRYGVMSDLMSTHCRTEVDIAKADRWDMKYRNLVTRAKQVLDPLAPPQATRQKRDY